MLKSLPLHAVALALIAGCSGTGTMPGDPFARACEGVMCGKGHCVLDVNRPACLCDADYTPDGLACVPVKQPPPDKCKPNPCVQQHRTACSVVNDAVQCACDPGTFETGGQCVLMTKCSPNPCTAQNQTTCTITAGAAVCSCNAGYAPQGTGCGTDKVYDCAAQHTGAPGDTYEPDECPALATAIYTDDLVLTGHTIAPAADADWFKITAELGHVYRVYATAMGTLALYVDIYAPNGTSTVGFDHRGGVMPSARFKATIAGAHYVRVRAFRAGDTGSYDLAASDLGLDDYEDIVELATPAAIGGAFTGELQFPTDLDVVRLPLPEGRKYSLSATGADGGIGGLSLVGSFPGLTAELIDPDRTTSLRRATVHPVTLITRSKATGDYFLKLSGGVGGAMGRFSFELKDLGPDDHGDVPAEATLLTPSPTSSPGTFELANDVDVFTFTAQAGHIYSFLCTPATGGYYGCLTTITDAAGTVLATSSSSYSSVVTYEFTQAGPFYVRTSTQYSYGGMATSYTYRFEDLGADDYGDAPASAGMIAVGGAAIAGRIETPLDKDVFSFTAVADHLYQVTCVPGTGLTYCNPQILNAAGAVLVTSSGSANTVTWEATGAGTLYAQVGSLYGYGGGAVGSYSVMIQDLGLDDSGDTIATATAILPSLTYASGVLEHSTDVDVFSFNAVAPNVYRFTCTPSGSSSYGGCALRLKNGAGATIQTANSSSSTSAVAVEALVSGAYYVEVSRSYSYTTGGVAYTYRLQNLGPDDFGDDRATASTITASGMPATGSLETPTDVDAFNFSAVALHIYKFSCTPPAGSSCLLTMRNAQGASVATGTNSYGGASFVTFEPSSAGTYTVEVSTSYNWVSDPYTFKLEDLGLDDHGDTIATATMLTVPKAATSASLESSNDVDVFSFSVAADRIYSFSATAASSYFQLRLKDGGGNTLATSGYSSNTVAHKASAATTWYVEVSSSSSTPAGAYSYQLVDVGPDDHGDTPATATALPAIGTALSGNLEYALDYDYFSIVLPAGRTSQVVTSGAYVYVSVYSPTGGILGYETSSSSVNFTTTVAGTYSVRVRQYSSGYYGTSYQVRVQ